jgi:cell fate (sporulation/competence/biofilm development) regulator YlbF (YheA/YmcA/DUF963 family)
MNNPDCLALSDELRAIEEEYARKMPDEKTAEYRYLTLKMRSVRTELQLHELIDRYEDTVDLLEKAINCIGALTEQSRHYKVLVDVMLETVHSMSARQKKMLSEDFHS